MPRYLLACLMLACLITFLGLPALGDELWSRFRGPNGSGVSLAPAPTQWSEGDFRWKTELPGEGHSSPIIFKGRIYVTSTHKPTARQLLLCIDARSGKILWKFPLESAPYPQHPFNSFASATPAADERFVYVPVSSADHYQIVAVTHEGAEGWRYDLGPFKSQHGSGASPIVYKDLVIVPNDQDGESFIAAVDGASGKLRWKTPRSSGRAAYGTPCVLAREGHDELVFSSQGSGVTALDPPTGKVLWEVGGLFKDRTVFSPVVAGNLVLGGSGEGGGGKRFVAIRPPSGSSPAKIEYEIDKSLPYVPTPLFYKGMLFLLADGGIVTCADAATGQVKWRERIPGAHFSSPIIAGDVLYCVSRDGHVTTLRAGDKFEQIARMPLGEPTHATPAAVGGVLYLRTERHLIRIGGPRTF